MALPAELKPRSKSLVMDLVEQAGLSVADWPNYVSGSTNPGANPKYCYEWALAEPGKQVVCNLWFKNMQEVAGNVEQHLRLTDSEDYVETNATRRQRRARMLSLLANAFNESLPIRVIVLDGIAKEDSANGKAKISARALDPVPWAVLALDERTGLVTLRRGALPCPYSDQYSLRAPEAGSGARRTVTGTVRDRSAAVRNYVLRRAKGHCEYCGAAGFPLTDGRVYLETHHIVPLSEDGDDSVRNVVALCPNHHREAHHGRDAVAMRAILLARVTPA